MPTNEYDEILSGGTIKNSGNEYADMLAEDKAMQAQSVKNSMFAAVRKNPDRQAEVMKLAKETNLPASLIERNYDKINEHYKLTRTDYEDLAKNNPGTARFLEDPSYAALAQDDLDSLKRIEKGAQRITAGPSRGFVGEMRDAGKTGYYNLEASTWHLSAAYGLMDTKEAAQYAAAANKRAQDIRAQMPSYATEFSNKMSKEGKDVEAAWDEVTAGYDRYREGDILGALVAYGSGGTKSVAEALDMIGTAVSNPRGLFYSTAENLMNSAPSMVLGLGGAKVGSMAGGAAGGLVTAPIGGVGAVPGAAVGGVVGFVGGSFAGSVPVEVGAWINQELQEKGVDITDPDQLQAAYSDAKLMSRIKGEAERKGLTTASVDAVFNAFAGKFLKAGKGASLGRKALRGASDTAVQMTGEAVSEGAGQYAAHGKVDIGESLQEGIISLGHSMGDVVVGATSVGMEAARNRYSKNTVRAAQEIQVDTLKAVEAQQKAEALKDLGQAIKESKTAQRNSESVGVLIDHTLGEQAHSVYFQTDDWDAYWQAKGESPVSAAADILGDGGRSYHEAKAQGTQLELPLNKYATKLGPTDDFNGLLSLVKTEPDAMNLEEGSGHLHELPNLMDTVAKEAITEQERLAQADRESAEIRKEIEGQLRAAGEDPRKAIAVERFFRTKAVQMGVSPNELYSRYNIRIGRPSNERVFNQGETIYSQDGLSFAKGNEVEQTSFPHPEKIKVVESANHIKIKTPKKAKGARGAIEPHIKRGAYVNEMTGYEIKFSNNTVTKAVNHAYKMLTQKQGSQGRQDHINALQYIPELIKNADYISTESHRGQPNAKYHIFMARLRVEGKSFDVKLQVSEDQSGFTLHNYALVNAKSSNALTNESNVTLGKTDSARVDGDIKDPSSMGSLEPTDRPGTQPEAYVPIEDFHYSVKQNRVEKKYFQQDDTGPTQDALGFYSISAKEIAAMDFKQVPAKDLKSRLMNAQVKGLRAEMEAIGLDKFLDLKDGKVTKEEVLDFINQNGVEIQQVVLSGDFHGSESEDTIFASDLEWSEPEWLSARDVDVDGLWDGEADYYLDEAKDEDSGYYEDLQDIKKELAEDHTDDEGNVDEEALQKEAEEKFLEARYEQFIENIESGDSIFSQQKYTLENLNVEITGNDYMGWYASGWGEARNLGEHFDDDIEEVKIKVAAWLIENGLVEDSAPVETDGSEPSINEPKGRTKFDRFTVKGGENYREVLLTLGNAPGFDPNKDSFVYRQHFSQPNILAHVRLTDRTNEKGERVLFIEEVQSDWHQQGREQGYKRALTLDEKRKIKELNAEIERLDEQQDSAKKEAITQALIDTSAEFKAEKKKAQDLVEKLEPLEKEQNETLISIADEARAKREALDAHNAQESPDKLQGDNLYNEYQILNQRIKQARNKLDETSGKIREAKDFIEYGKHESWVTKNSKWDRTKYVSIQEKKLAIEKEVDKLWAPTMAVPDAPLKQTEAWAGLAMKRMFRYAAEEGYDRIAWSPASVHVERWGTDSISWSKADTAGDTITETEKGYRLVDKNGTLIQELQAGGAYTKKAVKADLLKIKEKREKGGWLVGSVEQRGGQADDVDIEAEARRRGELLEAEGEFVSNKEELFEVISKTLNRERNDRSLKSLTDSVWKQMQAEDSGAKLPRKEGMELFYDRVIPRKVVPDILKRIDKKAAIEVDKIKTGDDELPVLSVPLTQKAKDKLIAQGQTLFQDDEGTKRGQIRFSGDGTFNIDLLDGANQSTFFHEMGHAFLEIMADLSATEGAPQEFRDDYQTILDFLGVKDRSEIQTEHHEKWARAFETYLLEGKAPTSKLRKAFNTFRMWMVSVYRDLKALVKLSPEVRDVMDRMFATENEIMEAEEAQGVGPLFDDPIAAGMSEKQAVKYREALGEARDYSRERLQRKLFDSRKRQQSREYKALKKRIKADVEAEVNASPIYKSLAILQGRDVYPDGSPIPENVRGLKLSHDALVQMYDVNFVKKRLPKPYIYSKEGGVHPDVAASLLGFQDADQMLTAMANAPKRVEAIKKATDMRAAAERPDLLTDPKISEEAINALYNDKRAQILQMELEFLAVNHQGVLKDSVKKVARRVPTQKAVKAQAARYISEQQVGAIKPHTFRLAERRYAKEAGVALAKGDVEAAFLAKQKELFNYELYREAMASKEKVDKAIKQFKKVRKADEKLAKTRDMDLVNAARAILAMHGLDRTNEAPASYIEKIKSYDPDTYASIEALVIAASKNPVPYKMLSYDEFLTVADSVGALWSLAKTQKEIEVGGKKIKLEQALGELQAQLDIVKTPKARKQYQETAGQWEKTKMYILGQKAALRRVESWVDEMDQGNKGKAFRKYVWEPVKESATQFREEKKKLIEKYLEIVKPIEKSVTNEPILAPEIGFKFKNKGELLAALMHTGNRSNKTKLLVGYGWGTLDEDGNLISTQWDAFIKRAESQGVLTKADYDYVQGVWDLFESIKPQAQRAHKKMYGHYFSEITQEEFQTSFGNYRGGYAPAIADPIANTDAAMRAEKEALTKQDNSFMFPTTGRGFTKSRVENYTPKLSLDLRLVPMHIDKTMRFVHIEPAVKDVTRLVWNRDFRSQLDDLDPVIVNEMLIPWLQRAAQQQVTVPAKGWGARGANYLFRKLRTNTGLNIMAANVVNTMQQFTGLSIAAVKVKPRFLRNALWRYMRAPKQFTSYVNEKSPWMRNRTTTQVMELQAHIDDLLLNPTKYEKARAFAQKHGYFMQAGTQNIVDIMVWAGAYEQAIEQGASEAEAVKQGDSAVSLTQGSFDPEDVSRFETGTPFMRAFTMFYSYFNMQANLLGTEYVNTVREMGLKKGAGRLLYVYVFGFMIPAFLSELMVKAAGGDFDEDDDDEYMDDILESFFLSQLRTGFAMFPGYGQVANLGLNAADDKWYNDRISVSPSVSMLESGVKGSVENVMRISQGKDVSGKKAIRDTLSLVGLLTGMPVLPLAKPLGYLSDVQEGKADPSGPIDFTRGLITGRPGDNN